MNSFWERYESPLKVNAKPCAAPYVAEHNVDRSTKYRKKVKNSRWAKLAERLFKHTGK